MVDSVRKYSNYEGVNDFLNKRTHNEVPYEFLEEIIKQRDNTLYELREKETKVRDLEGIFITLHSRIQDYEERIKGTNDLRKYTEKIYGKENSDSCPKSTNSDNCPKSTRVATLRAKYNEENAVMRSKPYKDLQLLLRDKEKQFKDQLHEKTKFATRYEKLCKELSESLKFTENQVKEKEKRILELESRLKRMDEYKKSIRSNASRIHNLQITVRNYEHLLREYELKFQETDSPVIRKSNGIVHTQSDDRNISKRRDPLNDITNNNNANNIDDDDEGNENDKINHILDTKNKELTNLHQQLQKMKLEKEDLHIKFSFAQSKLLETEKSLFFKNFELKLIRQQVDKIMKSSSRRDRNTPVCNSVSPMGSPVSPEASMK